MSPAAVARLRDLGLLETEEALRHPLAAEAGDFERAARVVALKEAEHRPMMEERFPLWAARINYWHVHDVYDCGVEEALAEIDRQVEALLVALADGG
jgi:protein-tyrosine phosphatase